MHPPDEHLPRHLFREGFNIFSNQTHTAAGGAAQPAADASAAASAVCALQRTSTRARSAIPEIR